MTVSPQPSASDDFFTLASRLAMLSEADCHQLAREAVASETTPSRLALERGLLTSVQIEILETLTQPATTIPGYEFLDVLGYGGMGVVYRARQKNLDRVVALKTVLVSQMTKSGVLARFEQEALTVAQLRHPNIVVAYDFGRSRGRLFLAMELVEGEELGQLIARRGLLDERTAWGLARQTAAGLSHAARLGIVHRDIKPANLLLVSPPEGFGLPDGIPMVKITDFGLALLNTQQEVDERLTAAGSTLGTPRYMAPEQFQGSNVDFRADIYALGATVYHMLAGSVPFPEQNLAQVLARKLNGRAAPLADVAAHVTTQSQRLVDDMMHPDPGKRLSTYDELFARIDRLLQSELPPTVDARQTVATRRQAGSIDDTEVLPTQPTTTSPVGAWRKLRRQRWLALAAVALSAAGLVGWKVFSRTPSAAVRLLVPTDREHFLYDGETLRGWVILDGQWTQAKDSEGARVLSGKGLVRRGFPPDIANYRLSLAACLNEATAIELQFGIAARSGNQSSQYVLRMESQGIEVAKKTGDRSERTTIGTPRPFPSAGPDSPVYHELRVERHDTDWLTFFDGQPLMQVPVLTADELREFRLLTEGGPAWIEAVQLTELAQPAAPIRE